VDATSAAVLVRSGRCKVVCPRSAVKGDLPLSFFALSAACVYRCPRGFGATQAADSLGRLQCRIADVPFEYENELLSCSRMVLTPLADRAFLALSLAVGSLKLACVLVGPTSCGKMATVKALGAAVGAFVVETRWCVVLFGTWGVHTQMLL
jgi:hypothetical protein